MKRRNRLVYAVIVIAAAFSLFSCEVKPFWWDRTIFSIAPVPSPIPPSDERTVVYFEEFFPGKHVSEVVWDSRKGPQWDGPKSFYVAFSLNVAPGATTVPRRPYTDIFYPFGRALSTAIKTAVTGSLPHSHACFNAACLNKATVEQKPRFAIVVRIINFRLWEGQPGYMSFYAKVSVRFTDLTTNTTEERDFERFRLGETAGWRMHESEFLGIYHPPWVQDRANKFTSDLALEILNYCKECMETRSPGTKKGG